MYARASSLAVALVLALAGCGADLVPVPQPGDALNPLPGDPQQSPTQTPPSRADCPPRQIERRAVWLSDIQFANAVTHLLGNSAIATDRMPDPALKPFSQKGAGVNTAVLRTRLDVAQRAAGTVRERFTEVTGCAAPDEGCGRAYVARTAEQAFRRPLTQQELIDVLDVYQTGLAADVPSAVELTLQAIVAAPSFNYRTELGAGAADAVGNVLLTDAEIGSLLSFWLTDSPPDAELRSAAAAGRLSQPAELERQVSRLIASPEAQNSLTLTLMAAWDMANVFGATKDPGLFPGYGPLLQSNMFEETRLFLNQMLWGQDGSLGQVLTSRQSYVNKALADLYKVPFLGSDPTQFVATLLPEGERAGLLTQASFLAGRARSDNTSVVARGLFVRTALLCLPRPPPPPDNLRPQLDALLAADLTERERAEYRAITSPCNSCHASMDGFGLMLENYDPIGRYREELQGEPIDATVDLTSVGFAGTFVDAVDFTDAAAESTDFTACVARHLAVYATGDDGLKPNDCQLAEFKDLAPAETDLRQIVTKLASSSLLASRSGGAQ